MSFAAFRKEVGEPFRSRTSSPHEVPGRRRDLRLDPQRLLRDLPGDRAGARSPPDPSPRAGASGVRASLSSGVEARRVACTARPSSSLREYKKKRDPKKTPEPFGGKKKGKQPIFVIQRHDARRLHYDFRLERDGALASWAVPKGIPLEPGQRALAVHVEDHPLEYASFEGEIPKGQYGAGLVEIWDNGTYELVEEKKNGGLTVRLHGNRLEGTWTLVPAKLDGNPKNWLILKKREDGAAEPRPRRKYAPMLATLAKESRPETTGSSRSSGTATGRSSTSTEARRR